MIIGKFVITKWGAKHAVGRGGGWVVVAAKEKGCERLQGAQEGFQESGGSSADLSHIFAIAVF